MELSFENIQLQPVVLSEAWTQYENLLNQAFPVPRGSSFFHDFPVWDPRFRTPDSLTLGVVEGGKFVSAASARIAQLRMGHFESVKVALLGGVVTEVKSQGKGLASQCVEQLCKWAALQGAEFILLWGSEQKFYEKLGFEWVGQQAIVPFNFIEIIESYKNERFSLKSGWNTAIFELAQKRNEGLILRPEDQTWYESHRHVQWLWLADSTGRPVSYLAFGRGIDLPGMVHEWGGEILGIKMLLQKIREQHPGGSLLCSPDHFSIFNIKANDLSIGPLAMAKMLKKGRSLQSQSPFWIYGLDSA
jgi:GNAT superfamily N-acetyltransferase